VRLLMIPIISAHARDIQMVAAHKLVIIRPGISLLTPLARTDKWWVRQLFVLITFSRYRWPHPANRGFIAPPSPT